MYIFQQLFFCKSCCPVYVVGFTPLLTGLPKKSAIRIKRKYRLGLLEVSIYFNSKFELVDFHITKHEP